MPRVKIPGQQKFNDAWATLAAAVEYLYNPTAGAGVSVERGPNGLINRVKFPTLIYIAQVTTEIPAGDGRLAYAPGGVVTILDDPGASPLVAGQLTGVPVKNYHEKKFKVDAVVPVFNYAGSWWVFDVGKCADYSS
jgi:hypothetical protein